MKGKFESRFFFNTPKLLNEIYANIDKNDLLLNNKYRMISPSNFEFTRDIKKHMLLNEKCLTKINSLISVIYDRNLLFDTENYMSGLMNLIASFGELKKDRSKLQTSVFENIRKKQEEFTYPINIDGQKTIDLCKNYMKNILSDLEYITKDWSVIDSETKLDMLQSENQFDSNIEADLNIEESKIATRKESENCIVQRKKAKLLNRMKINKENNLIKLKEKMGDMGKTNENENSKENAEIICQNCSEPIDNKDDYALFNE